MPLLSASSELAFENARNNAQNTWPARGASGNRVEPICKPVFQPSFSLVDGESVFTIGSCFARNVEAELERIGFDVPMRRIQVVTETQTGDPESNPNIFNNYSAPSILNELEWAIDPDRPFDAETCLVEVSRDSWCDLHLTRLLKAVSKAEALARRARIRQSMSSIRDCRVIVITLGLVECWFDRLAGRYLNIAPPKQAAKRQPDRFELHMLSHAEVLDQLERVVALLKRYGRPDHHIVLTVSPVPLGMTFTDQDVIVANAYSKAVLRAAAQELWLRHAHVDYFPSYESVTHSDRRLAWHDDLRHVTAEIVATNVHRMVSAYTGQDPATDDLMAQGRSLEKARRFEEAAAVYGQIARDAPDDAETRLALARCCAELGDPAAAVQALEPMLDDEALRLDAALAMARVHRLAGDSAGFARLAPLLAGLNDARAQRELLIGSFEFQRFDDALRHAAALERLSPRSPAPSEYRARVAIAQGRLEDAEAELLKALSVNQAMAHVYALLGKVQADLGKTDTARDAFRRALDINPRTNLALDGLRQMQAA